MRAALPPVLLRELQAQEAELAAARKELTRKLPRLLPPLDMRSDLRGHEPPNRLAKVRVLLREGGHHGPLARVVEDRSAHSRWRPPAFMRYPPPPPAPVRRGRSAGRPSR